MLRNHQSDSNNRRDKFLVNNLKPTRSQWKIVNSNPEAKNISQNPFKENSSRLERHIKETVFTKDNKESMTKVPYHIPKTYKTKLTKRKADKKYPNLQAWK